MRNKGKAGHICREWSGESKLLFSLGGILMSKHCLLKMFLPEETCRRNSTGSACVGNTLRLHLEHGLCKGNERGGWKVRTGPALPGKGLWT